MTDMKAEAAAGNNAAQTSDQYVPFLAMNDYFAMLAMAEIAKQGKGCRLGFLQVSDRLGKQCFPLGTGLPTWTPGKSITAAVPRVSN